MIILGIDPGLATIGYGIISAVKGKYYPIEYGAVRTKAKTLLEHRLEKIYDDMDKIITLHKIDAVSIEELFFNTNVTTAIDVS